MEGYQGYYLIRMGCFDVTPRPSEVGLLWLSELIGLFGLCLSLKRRVPGVSERELGALLKV